MNKLITFTALLLSFFFSTDQQQTKTNQEIIKVEKAKENSEFTINDKDYTLHFKLENTNKQKPVLVIAIELHKRSSFISPFEEKEFSGKFYMDLGDYTNLAFDGNIIETPQAVAKYDGFENAPVIWVKENTTYTQPLKIKTEDNFVVFGRLQFTIEPRCTFEEIPFAISYQDGVMIFIDPKC